MQAVSFVGAVMPLVYAGVAFVSVLVSSLGSNRCSLSHSNDYGTHVAVTFGLHAPPRVAHPSGLKTAAQRS